jgi:ribonuclease HI
MLLHEQLSDAASKWFRGTDFEFNSRLRNDIRQFLEAVSEYGSIGIHSVFTRSPHLFREPIRVFSDARFTDSGHAAGGAFMFDDWDNLIHISSFSIEADNNNEAELLALDAAVTFLAESPIDEVQFITDSVAVTRYLGTNRTSLSPASERQEALIHKAQSFEHTNVVRIPGQMNRIADALTSIQSISPLVGSADIAPFPEFARSGEEYNCLSRTDTRELCQEAVEHPHQTCDEHDQFRLYPETQE